MRSLRSAALHCHRASLLPTLNASRPSSAATLCQCCNAHRSGDILEFSGITSFFRQHAGCRDSKGVSQRVRSYMALMSGACMLAENCAGAEPVHSRGREESWQPPAEESRGTLLPSHNHKYVPLLWPQPLDLMHGISADSVTSFLIGLIPIILCWVIVPGRSASVLSGWINSACDLDKRV